MECRRILFALLIVAFSLVQPTVGIVTDYPYAEGSVLASTDPRLPTRGYSIADKLSATQYQCDVDVAAISVGIQNAAAVSSNAITLTQTQLKAAISERDAYDTALLALKTNYPGGIEKLKSDCKKADLGEIKPPGAKAPNWWNKGATGTQKEERATAWLAEVNKNTLPQPLTIEQKQQKAALIAQLTTQLQTQKTDPTHVVLSLVTIESVFGIAFVDVGTATTPSIRGFFAVSGASQNLEATPKGALIAKLNDLRPGLASWTIIENRSPSLAWLLSYTKAKYDEQQGSSFSGTKTIPAPAARQTYYGTLPSNYGTTAPTGTGMASVVFGIADKGNSYGPQVTKKWNAGQTLKTDGPTPALGTCAMQKLVGALYGTPHPTDAGSTGLPKLYAGADTATAANKLVCAAEAAHATTIRVKDISGTFQTYTPNHLVASCVACQAILPSLMRTPRPTTTTSFKQIPNQQEYEHQQLKSHHQLYDQTLQPM